jgi:hypothetical protein
MEVTELTERQPQRPQSALSSWQSLSPSSISAGELSQKDDSMALPDHNFHLSCQTERIICILRADPISPSHNLAPAAGFEKVALYSKCSAIRESLKNKAR